MQLSRDVLLTAILALLFSFFILFGLFLLPPVIAMEHWRNQ